jgi:hypothetical protein
MAAQKLTLVGGRKGLRIQPVDATHCLEADIKLR